MAKPTREIPVKIFLPLVEAAVAEGDDELQDLWARMFINAADAESGPEMRRAYTSILQDCTRLDIRILACLYNVAPELRGETVRSKFLPDEAKLVARDSSDSDHNPAPEVLRSLWNLHRLGLIAPDTAFAAGDEQMVNVRITALGVGLVKACTLRES
jgi:hypothetical protein